MSRYCPDHDPQPLLEAAQYWLKEALQAGGSVFASEHVWSDVNVASLKDYFVDHPDMGEGTFMGKLQRQLEPASPQVKQLAAEMTWFMLLCPSNISARNKRETVMTIWGWSKEAFPENQHWLSDATLEGVGSAGTAFNTHRWRELAFFIQFVQAYRALETDMQKRVLGDGWEFAKWLETLPDASSRQLRHMLLYLLFPDDFERIFGGGDRRRILRAFSGLSRVQVLALSPMQIDRQLSQIRKDSEKKYGRKDLDFYEPPLRDMWQKDEEAIPDKANREDSEFDKIATAMQPAHVQKAIEIVDREGYPSDARSTTYDLVHGSRRYPPKLIFSLAVKEATGEELPRTHFTGGDASKSFRILRDLGFAIERKDFVEELIQGFLKQADEGHDLTVSSYPKSYRGLDVNVSFGKGTLAKIPWISFTGFDQKTSEGIYPVVLYYRSLSRLVLAYGVSETSRPIHDWNLPKQHESITACFQRHGWQPPERYGASTVKEIFDLSERLEADKLQTALDELIATYYALFAGNAMERSGEPPVVVPPARPFTLEEAMDGMFMEEQQMARIRDLLRAKKNLILQGPPGVGKTYICKRLAYALMGERAPERLQMVQFHQSYSYEDFIQGYRPSGQGFRLKNGIFFDFCQAAKNDPANTYIFVIDEVNRGNLSKVFGEAMMLIEPDKRGPEWAIPLAYSETGEDRFYVPENVYLIGLMNTADRSLAMVDYALRRRFGFVDLTPQFESEQFQDFLEERGGERSFVGTLVSRLGALNAHIAEDVANLGPGYRVGHSFFCVIPEGVTPDWMWYRQIVESDIGPLLREYYFDSPSQAEELLRDLLRRE